MKLHEDPLVREAFIRDYVNRTLDSSAVEEFEAHYLVCDECFRELQTTELIVKGLSQGRRALQRRDRDGVVFIEFASGTQLTRQSAVAQQLEGILQQDDSRVLIDLSNVTRIDSAGLGLLMMCYSHALRNRGMLKVVRPSGLVKAALHMTRLDSVVEAYDDVSQAMNSFGSN